MKLFISYLLGFALATSTHVAALNGTGLNQVNLTSNNVDDLSVQANSESHANSRRRTSRYLGNFSSPRIVTRNRRYIVDCLKVRPHQLYFTCIPTFEFHCSPISQENKIKLEDEVVNKLFESLGNNKDLIVSAASFKEKYHLSYFQTDFLEYQVKKICDEYGVNLLWEDVVFDQPDWLVLILEKYLDISPEWKSNNIYRLRKYILSSAYENAAINTYDYMKVFVGLTAGQALFIVNKIYDAARLPKVIYGNQSTTIIPEEISKVRLDFIPNREGHFTN